MTTPSVPPSPDPGRPGRSLLARPLRASRAPLLVAVGDLLVDIVVRPEGPPIRGTDVPGTVRFRAGGSAANTARTFVRLGGRAALIAAVGSDAWARLLARALRAEGVQPRLSRARAPTGRLLALLAPDGERSFVTQRGAADGLRPAHVGASWPRGATVLHVPAHGLYSEAVAPAVLRAAQLARAQSVPVSVDLASRAPLLAFGARRARACIAEVGPALLLCDRGEAAALVGGASEGRLARLLDLAPLVVVKAGAGGCRVLWREADGAAGIGSTEVATVRITADDTTGAGDAFAAGFLHSLLAGGPGLPDAGSSAGGGAPRGVPGPAALRRAAMAGHRAAADLLRRRRPELEL